MKISSRVQTELDNIIRETSMHKSPVSLINNKRHVLFNSMQINGEQIQLLFFDEVVLSVQAGESFTSFMEMP